MAHAGNRTRIVAPPPAGRNHRPAVTNVKKAQADLVVVPGTGTGELAGVRGRGSFEAALGSDGRRSIDLEAEL